jgi:DNA-binding NarL/FixJ family response regulator
MEQVIGNRAKTASIEALTDRELEVLEMIGRGLATKIIAGHLCISARTVEAHRAHIKEKLSITDGAALVRYAVQWVESRTKV